MTTWKWMAGMRYIRPQYSHHHRVSEYEIENGYTFDDDCVPDWNDPATVGCLRHQVQQAFPLAPITTDWRGFSPGDVMWMCRFKVPIDAGDESGAWNIAWGKTEVEALFAALGEAK